jgi:hypothetical protein
MDPCTSQPEIAGQIAMNSYLLTLAYLDPGTGSMLLQAIVGGSAGLFVFARHIWRSFRYADVKKSGNAAQVQN